MAQSKGNQSEVRGNGEIHITGSLPRPGFDNIGGEKASEHKDSGALEVKSFNQGGSPRVSGLYRDD